MTNVTYELESWLYFRFNSRLPAMKGEAISTNRSCDAAPTGERFNRHHEHEAPPVSSAMRRIIVVAVVAALVLGYLLLNKLADISREEDCLFHHSKHCPIIELHGHQV